MMQFRSLAVMAACALLAACTDYATFVTATDIGISADVKTQDVNIGYARTELLTGPGYPETGEAPRAVAYIKSDLHVFAPHIQQLYATGEAAHLVTLPDSMLPDPKALPQPNPCLQPVSSASTISPPNPAFPPPPPAYCGQRRPLVFATGANVGLKLGFGAGTAPVPSSIKFGYNREEASVIPLQREQPAQGKPDQYAPVLAAMDLDLRTTAEAASTNLGITQFFATGSAARNLAAHNPDIRRYFKAQAGAAVQQASLREAVAVVARERETAYDAIVAYFDKFQLIGFGIARDNLLQESRLTSGSAFARLKAAPTREDFLNYVQGESGLINRLAPAAISLSARQ